MSLVGQVFWLALAIAVAGILHMAVVALNLWPALKRPLDGGRTLGDGRRIFGDNKTWRGFLFMILGTAAVGFVQGLAGGPWAAASGVELMDFHALGGQLVGGERLPFAVGYALVNAVLGFGYALGELPNSFIKRRLDITPGKTHSGLVGGFFFLIDQADSVIAGLLIGKLAFGFSWAVVGVGIACLTGLHLLINASLYLVKLRKNL